MIDLRSDTMTKPSRAMRDAMANAEVGDEQEREDPTVLELERRAAVLLGQEESVYLPTATMGNQIALAILGERGSELIVEERAHIMVSELGGAAMHSGLQTRGLPGYRGPPDPGASCGRPSTHATTTTTGRHERRFSQSRTLTTPPAAPCGRSTSSASSSQRRASSACDVHLDGARLDERSRCGRRACVRDRRPLRHRHPLLVEGPRLPARSVDRRLA